MLTDMDQPLGQGGRERARDARGGRDDHAARGRPTSRSSCSTSVAHLLALSDLGIDEAEGRKPRRGRRSRTARRSRPTSAGSARRAATPTWARCRGAPVVREVARRRAASSAGSARSASGIAALHLGAGRRTKEDAIDHAVGVVCRAKRGDAVEAGEPLAEVHARDEAAAAEAARPRSLAAYELGDEAPPAAPDRPRRRRLPVPELPEVETERGRLAARLEGRRIVAAPTSTTRG